MKKILVAMSGGVDSSAALFLLQQAGYKVAGAFMHLWVPRQCVDAGTPSCCSKKSRDDARMIAERLGVPFHVFDFQEEFQRDVIDYFKDEYIAGRTPNPCTLCNEKIKFKLFLERARALGMDGMATGHYASIEQTEAGHYTLCEGHDEKKDQSYFLFSLTQEQLKHTLFPLGKWTKDKIKALAREQNFFNAPKKESQEVCFITEERYSDFLKNEYNIKPIPGDIKDTNGTVLGKHQGYFNYTVGQRRGLGVAAPHPLYVIKIDPKANEVIVGPKEETLCKQFEVHNVSWMAGRKVNDEFDTLIRVRYNQKKVPARIRCEENKCFVTMRDQQEAITPGQAAVFYDTNRIIGGGWIA